MKNFDSIIPDVLLNHEELTVIAQVTRELRAFRECLEKQRIRDGLKHILSVSRLGNGFMQSTKPWELVKRNRGDDM